MLLAAFPLFPHSGAPVARRQLLKKARQKFPPERLTLRASISRLKTILQLPTRSYDHKKLLDSLLAAIDALPIPHWKKSVLFHYYDPEGRRKATRRQPRILVPPRSKPHPLESRNRPEARYWRLSALEERIRYSLPQTTATERFFKLWKRCIATGFARSFTQVVAPHAVEVATEDLHKRYEQEGSFRALEVLAGATRGSKARPQWVREAMREAKENKIKLNLKGSGRQRTRTLKKVQLQKKQATERYREKIAEAKGSIVNQINGELKEEEKSKRLPRGQEDNYRAARHARVLKVLQSHETGEDLHFRIAAKQIRKKLKKK